MTMRTHPPHSSSPAPWVVIATLALAACDAEPASRALTGPTNASRGTGPDGGTLVWHSGEALFPNEAEKVDTNDQVPDLHPPPKWAPDEGRDPAGPPESVCGQPLTQVDIDCPTTHPRHFICGRTAAPLGCVPLRGTFAARAVRHVCCQ
jgi:hypothetical protein